MTLKACKSPPCKSRIYIIYSTMLYTQQFPRYDHSLYEQNFLNFISNLPTIPYSIDNHCLLVKVLSIIYTCYMLFNSYYFVSHIHFSIVKTKLGHWYITLITFSIFLLILIPYLVNIC